MPHAARLALLAAALLLPAGAHAEVEFKPAFGLTFTDVSKVSTIDVGQSRSVYLNAGVRF